MRSSAGRSGIIRTGAYDRLDELDALDVFEASEDDSCRSWACEAPSRAQRAESIRVPTAYPPHRSSHPVREPYRLKRRSLPAVYAHANVWARVEGGCVGGKYRRAARKTSKVEGERGLHREQQTEEDAEERPGQHLNGRVANEFAEALGVDAALVEEVVHHKVEDARLLANGLAHA